jgi:hypothetical protein
LIFGTNLTFSAAVNTTNSPFLRLLAELRKRIYNYALGGHILHVASHLSQRGKSGSGPVVICTCPHDYEQDDTSHSLMRHEPSRPQFLYATRYSANVLCLNSHQQCYEDLPAWKGLSVHVLQACRQIYHEGKLERPGSV